MQNARARNARAKVLLSTETETLNQGTVTVDVDALEVIKHTTTVTDHEQQTTTGVVIVLVLLQVLGQVGDTLAQQRDLDLGEPVSPSCVAYLVMISCFSSAVSATASSL